MSEQEIEDGIKALFKKECEITTEVLKFINLAEDCNLYLKRGYSSLFDWLVNGIGYSVGAAYRRIEAAGLMRVVPEVCEKIERNEVNLTTLSKARKAIRAREKASGKKMSRDEQAKVVNGIQNKTSEQVDFVLVDMIPESAQAHKPDRKEVVDSETIRYSCNVTREASEDLEWAKSFLSHVVPDGDMGLVITRIAKYFRMKHDEVLKAKMREDALRAKNENSAKGPRADRKRKTNKADEGQYSKEQMKKSGEGRHQSHASGAAETKSAKQNDSDAKSTSAAEVKPSKAAVRRMTIIKSEGSCDYVDPKTGKRCGTTYQVQQDHIIPKAKGGTDDPSNLRSLCRAHNLLEAEEKLGVDWANCWRNNELTDDDINRMSDEDLERMSGQRSRVH